ncbi:MAG: phosphomethylpyrimidine synthase [Clostridia bacterium]|nr:phosphomethylpyrimidine synthase [Clostridia bacterium]
MTQLEAATVGQVTRAMEVVAEKNGRSPRFVPEGIASGTIVIPANVNHHTLSPAGFRMV